MHFVIGVPALFDSSSFHAVLVTVLWNPDKEKPTVIYMDSNNRLLGENPTWMLSPALYLFFKTMNEALAPESSQS